VKRDFEKFKYLFASIQNASLTRAPPTHFVSGHRTFSTWKVADWLAAILGSKV